MNICFVRANIDKDFIKKLGDNLRKIRESKNISMQALADTVDVEYSQISRIERGIINTSVGLIFEISKALEVDVQELFHFKNSVEKD